MHHQRLILVLGRVRLLQSARDHVEATRGCGFREALLQPARDDQRVIGAIGQAGAARLEHVVDHGVEHPERQPHLGRDERHGAR